MALRHVSRALVSPTLAAVCCHAQRTLGPLALYAFSTRPPAHPFDNDERSAFTSPRKTLEQREHEKHDLDVAHGVLDIEPLDNEPDERSALTSPRCDLEQRLHMRAAQKEERRALAVLGGLGLLAQQPGQASSLADKKNQ